MMTSIKLSIMSTSELLIKLGGITCPFTVLSTFYIQLHKRERVQRRNTKCLVMSNDDRE